MTISETPHGPFSDRIHVRQLAQTPFIDVFRAFDGFIPPDAQRRGGYPLDNHPTHPRESSFNPDQYPLVQTAMACLGLLARGRTFIEAQEDIPPFSKRVEIDFLKQGNFSRALTTAMLDVLTDFGRFYPNLTPALLAVSSTAGAVALAEVVLFPGQEYLGGALSGNLTPENKTTFDRSSSASFVFQHKRRRGRTKAYRVECPAEGATQTLLLEMKNAALLLTMHEGVKHNPTEPHATPRQDQHLIQAHIEDVAQDALERYQRGEI